MNNKIDFVITWVDNKDEKWIKEKSKYTSTINSDDEINRYRDWELLKYWFRGVEKFAPWVNNIYFITYGHLPKFLNTKHQKLKIIKHSDFINQEYLPLFNSNAIEFNIKNIKDLSENFVLFSDDVLILKNVKPSDFFKNDLPCDEYGESSIIITPKDNVFPHTLLNNLEIINKYYNKKIHFKFYKLRYGKNLIRTFLLLPYSKYTGFYNPHICQSFKKSYFEKLYKMETEDYLRTCSSRFRSKDDLTQYLVRYMQLMDLKFMPRSSKFGKYLEISNTNTKKIKKYITKQKCKVICLNDTNNDVDFEFAKKEILRSLNEILPEKSSFEI